MNPATRLTLAVLSTVSIVALTGGIVLADVASDFEAIFGAEAKKVAASGIKADDAAFAAKLLKSAKKMPDAPKLQVLVYERASEFGSAGPAGYDTAMEALGFLEKNVPDKKTLWRQKKLNIVKHRFDKSLGDAKKIAAQPYMEMLDALADARVDEGKGDQAKALYDRAHMVATYISSPRADEISAKSKRVDALVVRQANLKSLKTKITADPKDTAARKELIALCLVEFDSPVEAAKWITDDLDEAIRTYVPLATGRLTDLNEAVCLELGAWYHRELSKSASVIGKGVVLRRARGYYQQFVKLHDKKDVLLFRTKAVLENIEKELKKSETSPDRASRTAPETLMLTLGDGVGMKLIRIPSGKFNMGSPKTEIGRKDNEGPQRQVTIGKLFYIGSTEVTQSQYECVMGKNPSEFKGARNPVEQVSWTQAAEFCRKLSSMTGHAVRLPTETQWEYAARMGRDARLGFAEEEDWAARGWCKDNSGRKTHPVDGERAYTRDHAYRLSSQAGKLSAEARAVERAIILKRRRAKARKADPLNEADLARDADLAGEKRRQAGLLYKRAHALDVRWMKYEALRKRREAGGLTGAVSRSRPHMAMKDWRKYADRSKIRVKELLSEAVELDARIRWLTTATKPNPSVLCGMHGNVREWCRDWYAEKFYANARNVDPENATKSKVRVVRGGSWSDTIDNCRAASRNGIAPDARKSNIGFRVVVEYGAGVSESVRTRFENYYLTGNPG